MTTTHTVPHFNVHSTEYEPLPEFGGRQAILYRSDDGKRLAGSFPQSGTHTQRMPFDEFAYVLAGTCSLTVSGESFTVSTGDCWYLREGQEVTFAMSDDFHVVCVLISDTQFDHVRDSVDATVDAPTHADL